MEEWAGMIAQADNVISRVFQEDNVFLLHHDDADGCCAAAILLHLFSTQSSPQIAASIAYTSPENHSVEITQRLMKKLMEKRPKYIISVDLALTKSGEKITSILDSLKAKMLAYDHHAHSKSRRWPKEFTYLNPLSYNLGNIPASCFSYILHKHYTKKDDSCWVAAIGTIADYRTSECKDLVKKIKHNYPDLYPYKSIDQLTALRSPLMTMGNLINAGYQHSDHNGARIAVEALVEAMKLEDPTILLKGETKRTRILHKFRLEVDQELKEHLKRFESKTDFHPDSSLAFYFLKPKFNITSQLSTQLQHSYPNTIVAIISPETEKTLKVSLRRGINVKIDLAFLAEKTSSKLEGASGGGHKDAAGCILWKEDLDEWKKTILNLLEKIIK